MPILLVPDIIKIIDEWETQKNKKKKRNKQRKKEAIVEGWELKYFVLHLS